MPKKKQAPGGAVGKGGVDPAPRAEDCTVRPVAEQLVMVPIDDLVPYTGAASLYPKGPPPKGPPPKRPPQ